MSIWQARLAGAQLLDLFAGSGAVGLEALGRGAEKVVAIERDPRVLAGLESSFELWSAGRARALRALLPRDLQRAVGESRFDLVFADPPYDFEDFAGLLEACATVLARGGELVVEHSARASLPESIGSLAQVRSRRYGESALTAYRHETPGGAGEEE